MPCVTWFQIAHAEPQGNIIFQPNQIPEVNVYYEHYSFVFELKSYFIRVKPFIIYDGEYFGMKQIVPWIKNRYPNINYKWLIERATSAIHYGFNLTKLPQNVADKIDYLGFRLVDLNFPLSWFELETIDSFVDLGYNITRIHIRKANLCFSFEDLYPFGYSMDFVNSTYVLVGNVKGKTNLYADPIVESGGVITITGYDTEGGCADHNEIYDEIGDDTIFKKTGNQYYSNAKIVIGDGENTTWFVDTNVQVEFNSSVFTANYQIGYDVKANSHLRFGALTDATAKSGREGVSVRFTITGYIQAQYFVVGRSGSDVQLYASIFVVIFLDWNKQARILLYDSAKIYQCYLSSTMIWVADGSTVDIFDVTGNFRSGLVPYGGTPTIDRFTSYYSTWTIRFYTNNAGNVTNFYQRAYTSEIIYCQAITVDHYITNGDLEAWSFKWDGTSTAEIYRKYTFDLTVTFPNGTAIEGATVTIKHYGQTETEDYSGTTDASGQIAQQTLTMGFYNQTGADVLYSYNPHELNITYSGYDTYLKNFTLSEQTTWEISMIEETETTTTTTEGASGLNDYVKSVIVEPNIRGILIIVGLFAIVHWIYKWLTNKPKKWAKKAKITRY